MTAYDPYPNWRLLPPEQVGGARQMAMDQALLESAADEAFLPTLRFQYWEPAAISIGRFQDISEIDLEACATRNIEVVRRPTGGKCILHRSDFTYSVVLPSRFPISHSVVEAYTRLCRGILDALECLGLPAVMQSRDHEDYSKAKGACFAAVTAADLSLQGRKVCGSAQVRRHGALLQHGTILLKDTSRLLFELLRFEHEKQREGAVGEYRERCISLEDVGHRPGWSEVADAMRKGFGKSFCVEFIYSGLTAWEEERSSMLASAYASQDWLLHADTHHFPPGGFPG